MVEPEMGAGATIRALQFLQAAYLTSKDHAHNAEGAD
jgi:hypothetical protein